MTLNWVAVGSGRIVLTHRPKLRDIPRLPQWGCDRVVTLLSHREGAPKIGQAVQAAGLAWTWLPLANGKPPIGEDDACLRAALPELAGVLDKGSSLLIHCSAGIHRTGMVAYALLRWRGATEVEALDLVGRMRSVTREGLQDHHLAWGNTVAAS